MRHSDFAAAPKWLSSRESNPDGAFRKRGLFPIELLDKRKLVAANKQDFVGLRRDNHSSWPLPAGHRLNPATSLLRVAQTESYFA